MSQMTEKLNSSNLRQNPRNVNELVNELTLFDDDLMSVCLIKHQSNGIVAPYHSWQKG